MKNIPEWWELVDDTLVADFPTGTFTTGVALINEISTLAEAANHHPDVLLTYPSVTVSLISHDAGTVTDRDYSLAADINDAAEKLGVI